jgi:hypothetical protein
MDDTTPHVSVFHFSVWAFVFDSLEIRFCHKLFGFGLSELEESAFEKGLFRKGNP